MSTEASRTDERLTDLEIKVTYQDETIETLNQCVITLQTEVDRLQKIVSHLELQMAQAGLETGPANDPPPHY